MWEPEPLRRLVRFDQNVVILAVLLDDLEVLARVSRESCQ
jgi:hypothetical protein